MCREIYFFISIANLSFTNKYVYFMNVHIISGIPCTDQNATSEATFMQETWQTLLKSSASTAYSILKWTYPSIPLLINLPQLPLIFFLHLGFSCLPLSQALHPRGWSILLHFKITLVYQKQTIDKQTV